MLTAAVLGAIIMVCADWIGRTLWFPWQFPAGPTRLFDWWRLLPLPDETLTRFREPILKEQAQ